MHRVIRILTRTLIAIVGVAVVGFLFLYFSPRPTLTIDPATLAGDGSVVNYCDLPVLDRSGKRAAEIPKGNTPGCSYSHFPLPVLRECTEPLPDDADDLRGLWIAVTGRVGHVERIEQCGERVVVTASGIIHDSGPNSTAGLATNDTLGSVLFTLGDREYCPRTSAGTRWRNGVLNFQVFGWGTDSGAPLHGRRATCVGILGRRGHAHGSPLHTPRGAQSACAAWTALFIVADLSRSAWVLYRREPPRASFGERQ